MKKVLLAWLSGWLLLVSLPVLAQEEGGDEADAAVDSGKRQFFLGLLKEGKALADKGFYYEACVAFNGILERGDRKSVV